MKYISVMIVDDEKLVLEDLEMLVDWKQLGFKIVATAYNGRQALAKYNVFQPQVIITDIKMPYMDGIELIENLRKIDSQAQILLLTAYEDFSYAQKAISCGIMEYIIKSNINKESFTSLLLRLKKIIEDNEEREKLLKDIKISEFILSESENTNAFLEKIFTTSYYYLIVEKDVPLPITRDFDNNELRYTKKEILNLVVNIEGKCEIIATSSLSENRILVILELEEVSQKNVSLELFKYARAIEKSLESNLNCSFSIYLLLTRINLIALKKKMPDINGMIMYKYLSGCHRINCFDNIQAHFLERNEIIVDFKKIKELMDNLQSDELNLYIKKLFELIETKGNYDILIEISKELYDFLKREADALPLYIEKVDLSTNNNWKKWLDIFGIKEWFSIKFSELMTKRSIVKENMYSKIVKRSVSYIYDNYSRHNLSIGDVAKHVNLSTGRLCAIFKQETGKTINNYITEIRISEAKRHLDEGKLKVYEITEIVGYQSSQYFSQIFYKITGIYPTEYQKGKR